MNKQLILISLNELKKCLKIPQKDTMKFLNELDEIEKQLRDKSNTDLLFHNTNIEYAKRIISDGQFSVARKVLIDDGKGHPEQQVSRNNVVRIHKELNELEKQKLLLEKEVCENSLMELTLKERGDSYHKYFSEKNESINKDIQSLDEKINECKIKGILSLEASEDDGLKLFFSDTLNYIFESMYIHKRDFSAGQHVVFALDRSKLDVIKNYRFIDINKKTGYFIKEDKIETYYPFLEHIKAELWDSEYITYQDVPINAIKYMVLVSQSNIEKVIDAEGKVLIDYSDQNNYVSNQDRNVSGEEWKNSVVDYVKKKRFVDEYSAELYERNNDKNINSTLISNEILQETSEYLISLSKYQKIFVNENIKINEYILELKTNESTIIKVRFREKPKQNILYDFSIIQLDDMEYVDIVSKHFKKLYYEKFNGYGFYYQYGVPKMEQLIKRKIKQNKLPVEIIEKKLFA
ncbi:hypothetical protein [Schinkia azotoformans]|uniref:hypothetical protein n=1 Tax=Schinkia azotoformans TaxID=1454 RepID=UPI002DBCE416|nr:hypothetical protein [Schinkia azotoformans]MEC1697750.1 hypothetical protein [Schinkia azotoformans]